MKAIPNQHFAICPLFYWWPTCYFPLDSPFLFSPNTVSLLVLYRHRSYLEKAERIDPKYCDVNYQFAHCHVQQGKYFEFEERLTKALLCPFTMGQAIPLWQNYWKQVTSDPRSGAEAKDRMDKYQAIINEAIEEDQQKEREEEMHQLKTRRNEVYGGDEL